MHDNMASRPVENSHLLSAGNGLKTHPTYWERVEPSTDSDGDYSPPEHKVQYQPSPDLNRIPPEPTFGERIGATWLFEVIGLLVSAAALAGIVYVLRRYDGQRIPNWGALSFNALISILTTVSKMAALYGATSAISQLKWVWFAEKDKSLLDYKVFDAGSRGVTGAASLVWALKGRCATDPPPSLPILKILITA